MLTSFFRKAKKSGSNIFAMFSQRQIQEFKEAFGIMDCDKNGLLSADDLVSAFAAVGKSISGGEADNMLSESPGPVNFTQMVTLFAEKMAGGKQNETTSMVYIRLQKYASEIIHFTHIISFDIQVPMMTTPSLNLLMHSKSTAKLMQKCKFKTFMISRKLNNFIKP